MAAPPIPDLLSPEPTVRIDVADLRQTLVFAFATGGSTDAFDQAVASATLPASGWDRAQFSRDLFLEQLVERCLTARIGGRDQAICKRYMLRAIGEPPLGPEVAAFRRRVLGELAASDKMRDEFERVYLEIVRVRALLCAGRIATRELRRLEILRAIHKAFGTIAASFDGASSGLSRLSSFGRAVCEGDTYKRLDAMLDHEGHLSTVDLRVRVGSDGELRTFQIVSVRENKDNPFHASPLGRWLARIALILRGYRMNGGEVLERLFDDLFTGLEVDIALLFQLLGDMEFYLGGLALRDKAEEKGLSVCFPEMVDHPGGRPGAPADEPAAEDGGDKGIEIEALWNPLLLGEKTTPVPCDLRVAQAGSVVIVTGPNSGGKTRLLQAIAICQLLGEVGLFVPGKSARLPRAAGLFVSLLEEARADQPEGQLGMELLRIRRMFEDIGIGSLVLLDELCSGTNPSEGEEIARLVISLLPELRAQVFITTHLLQFAARLAEERPIPRLEFREVELDAYERPTYAFREGVARTSLAHKTAARLGVTRDELLALVAAKKRALTLPAGKGKRSGAARGDEAPRADKSKRPARAAR